jgi:hypothetical protein
VLLFTWVLSCAPGLQGDLFAHRCWSVLDPLDVLPIDVLKLRGIPNVFEANDRMENNCLQPICDTRKGVCDNAVLERRAVRL